MISNNIEKAIDIFIPELRTLYPAIPTIESCPTTPKILVNNKELLLFCSNNYLGLASADFVKEAAIKAIKRYGYGSAGSRWISGTTDLHRKLEEEIARFKKKEDAVSFSAGFMTNAGVIPALTGALLDDKPFSADEAAIFSDELNHASIIDGCRNSRAKVYVYNHKDTEHLSKLLEASDEKYKLIITDGVFSMDGDIAPLDQIIILAKQFSAMVMVDEAHAIGILGETGRGTAEYFDVENDIEISMGTLSKTFGALGGYVACRRHLAEYIRCAARTYVFSAAMPASTAAVVLSILKCISNDQQYKKKVLDLSNYLRSKLNEMGFDTLDSETAIIPIFIGDETTTIALTKKLFEHGIYLSCAVWPAVEKKKARLRATVSASHSKKDIDQLLTILDHCFKEHSNL